MDENIAWNPIINWSLTKASQNENLVHTTTGSILKSATGACTVASNWNTRKTETLSETRRVFWNKESEYAVSFQPITPLLQQVKQNFQRKENSSLLYNCEPLRTIRCNDGDQNFKSGHDVDRNLPLKVSECEGKIFEYSDLLYDTIGTIKGGIVHLVGDNRVISCFFCEWDLWGCCPGEVGVGTRVSVNARLLPPREHIQGIHYMAASVWRIGMRIPPVLRDKLMEAVDHEALKRYKILATQLDLRNSITEQKSRTHLQAKISRKNRPRSGDRSQRSRSGEDKRSSNRSCRRSGMSKRHRSRSRKCSRSVSRDGSQSKRYGRSSRGRDRKRSRESEESRSRSTKRRCSRSNKIISSKNRSARSRESRSNSIEIISFTRGTSQEKEYKSKVGPGASHQINNEMTRKNPRLERGFHSKPALRESWKLQLPSPVPSQKMYWYFNGKEWVYATLPHSELTLPLVYTTLPHPKVTLPPVYTTLPHPKVTLPPVYTTLPYPKVTIPPVYTTLPHPKVTLPPVTTLPHPKVNVPMVYTTLSHPKINVPTSYSTLPHPKVMLTSNIQNCTGKQPSKWFDWYHNGREWVYATEQPLILESSVISKPQKWAKCRICQANYNCSEIYNGIGHSKYTPDYNIHINGVIHQMAVAGVKHEPKETLNPLFKVSSEGSIFCNVCSCEFDSANVMDSHIKTNSHSINAQNMSEQELLILSGSKGFERDINMKSGILFDKGPDLKVPKKEEIVIVKAVTKGTRKKEKSKERRRVKRRAKDILYDIIDNVAWNIPESVKFRPMFESTNTNVSDSMICNLCGVTWMASRNIVKRNLAVEIHRRSNDHCRNEKHAESLEGDCHDERPLKYSDAIGQWLKDTIPKTKEVLTKCLKTLPDNNVLCIVCPLCPPMTKYYAENLHIKTESHIQNMPVFYGDLRIEEMDWYPLMVEDYFKYEVYLTFEKDVELACVKKEHNLKKFYDHLDVVGAILNDILSNIEQECGRKIDIVGNDLCCESHFGGEDDSGETCNQQQTHSEKDFDMRQPLNDNVGEVHTEEDMWLKCCFQPSHESEHNISDHPDICKALELDAQSSSVVLDPNEASSLLHLIQQKRETLGIIDVVLRDMISDIVENEDSMIPASPVEDSNDLGTWIEKCIFCAKRHIGSKMCTARLKTCKFCKKVGHLEKVHLEQDPTFRDTILSALNNNDRGDIFVGVRMWTNYKPQKPVWKVDPRTASLLILEL